MSAVLSSRYVQRKATLKRDIQANIQQWFSIGEQLHVIKESGDWRQEFGSLGEFVTKCAGFTKRQVDGLIADARAWKPMLELLEQMGTTVPTLTEGTMREVLKLGTTEERVAVVVEIQNSAQPVNSGTVKKAREKRAKAKVLDAETGEPEPEPEKRCPTCGKPL